MNPRKLYFALFVAGVAIPYSQFVPWLLEHGLDMRLFFGQLFANRISAFFGADVLVSAVVVAVFASSERARLGSRRWIPILAMLLCGVSAGLPLLLFLRERREA